jgi:hypothetical protein
MKRPFDDPFSAIEPVLKAHPPGGQAQAVLVDMHCEATSEKMAMGHFCDGRASVVVGTHTHVPTADAMILPGGTAYQTDAGMCGDYNSVIGMDKAEPMRRFITGMSKGRFSRRGARPRCRASSSRPTTAPARRCAVEMVRAGGCSARRDPRQPGMTRPAALLAVLVTLGAGWGITQPLAKIAVSEGYRHFGSSSGSRP